jgi:hypothetical protein
MPVGRFFHSFSSDSPAGFILFHRKISRQFRLDPDRSRG